MNNDSGKKITDSPEANLGRDLKQVSNSRRSFAKAGLIAPVMLSLANRPAWGASFRCTVSGFDSLATIGSGPALTDIEAMCDYMSVGEIYLSLDNVDLALKVSDIFPSCADADFGFFGFDINADSTVDEAFNSSDILIPRLMASYYNVVNPFGNCPVEEIFCHYITYGASEPYSFGGVILHGMEIYNFLGYVGIK